MPLISFDTPQPNIDWAEHIAAQLGMDRDDVLREALVSGLEKMFKEAEHQAAIKAWDKIQHGPGPSED